MKIQTVAQYFDQLSDQDHLIATVLHDLVCSVDDSIVAKIRYQTIFYDANKWCCYINTVKPRGVELCFLHAKELTDPAGVLSFRKRKMVAGVIVTDVEQIPLEPLLHLLEQAVALAKSK